MFLNDNMDFMAMTRERSVISRQSHRDMLPKRVVANSARPILGNGQYVFSDNAHGLICGPVSDTLDAYDILVR